jgi:Tfp pilus assembly protein FimV
MHGAVCRGCPAAWKCQLEETQANLKERETAVKKQQEATAKKEDQLEKEQQRLAAESKRLQVCVRVLPTLPAAASNTKHMHPTHSLFSCC